MRTLVGTSLNGRYRLDEKVGAGGMSTVYRAFDTTLERPVAIKLLHREIAADSDQIERFRREARAVAQLSHPHIVTVIDAGEDDGRPYIVFEYVPGETLKDRIKKAGRLPVSESVAYAIEIARALGCAHGNNIVHRDVKPQNVLVDAEGRAKVTDFGIARSLDEEGLTADGRVLGTTDYVSPEQALGHACTGQSDLYSLGIVLYEMLTGEVPFKGENQVAVAMKHVREALPDVQAKRPEVSAALASVIDRATSKDLKRRYASDEELIADLEDALALETARAGSATGEATSVLRTLPASARRRLPLRVVHPGWFALAGVVALAAAASLAILLPGQTHRGTGTRGAGHPRGLTPISLSQNAATDFDPYGTGGEHHEQTALALDRDGSTVWTTENYSGGLGSKPGVGIYVDAEPGVAARALELRTPDPGFTAAVYATDAGPPKDITAWTVVSPAATVTEKRQRFALNTGGRSYRWYLVWITKLSGQAKIAELYLFR
ncbi:MAG: eukaryotic-like serine/threonine-protein kinase [Solirubrobacteraceae bacterium]|jgi:serine/threonine-protein kinase|nr:eukaryotic-like serine/threonine-protein kinase [Solirubrobacteraceae bacterium]